MLYTLMATVSIEVLSGIFTLGDQDEVDPPMSTAVDDAQGPHKWIEVIDGHGLHWEDETSFPGKGVHRQCEK